MFVPNELLESVGFLYEGVVSRAGAPRREKIGSCFFITVWNEARDGGFGYIVTAKHVIDGRSNLFLRLNKLSFAPGTTGVKYFPLPTDWVFHDDNTVDLAVLPWGSVKNNFTCSSLPFDAILATPEFCRANGGVWPPRIGEALVFIGMMSQVAGVARNYPIARRGFLELVTGEKIEGEYGPSEYLIADLQTYPGHSGGPVWVAFDQLLFLLGVMAAGYEQPYLVSGKRRKTEQYNLGVSLVVPVAKLTDIILSPALTQRRKEESPRPVLPIPTI